ncbi:hypothetical protein [Trichoplusia ni ascovirus 6b]|nr:hypothetical protein [Trichoplusia ni ascovirus 6b]
MPDLPRLMKEPAASSQKYETKTFYLHQTMNICSSPMSYYYTKENIENGKYPDRLSHLPMEIKLYIMTFIDDFDSYVNARQVLGLPFCKKTFHKMMVRRGDFENNVYYISLPYHNMKKKTFFFKYTLVSSTYRDIVCVELYARSCFGVETTIIDKLSYDDYVDIDNLLIYYSKGLNKFHTVYYKYVKIMIELQILSKDNYMKIRNLPMLHSLLVHVDIPKFILESKTIMFIIVFKCILTENGLIKFNSYREALDYYIKKNTTIV